VAIRIIDGVPGAGKSYFAVNHLLAKYFAWNKELDEWEPKAVEGTRTRVFSNIDSLVVAESLDDAIEKAGGLASFFTVDYQKKLSADGVRCVYVIDEAQRMFPRSFKGVEVAFYFQYHRHLGADVYLITQDVKLLALELRHLAEYIVRAVRRTYSVAGEFRYRFLGSTDDPHAFQVKVLRRDRRVFAAYTSMVQGEGEKIKSAPLRFMVAAGVCLVAIASLFGFVVYSWSHKDATAAELTGPSVGRYAGLGLQRRSERDAPVLQVAPVAPRASEALPVPRRAPLLESVVTVEWMVGDALAGQVSAVDEDARYRFSVAELIARCRCMLGGVMTGERVPLYVVESLPRLAARGRARTAEGKGSTAGAGVSTSSGGETLPVVGRSVLPFSR
jgi:Zonular occludens toxin (Zot)